MPCTRNGTPATICSPSTWRWSRFPASRPHPGTRATATSSSGPTSARCAASRGCRARPWCWATSPIMTATSCRTARARSSSASWSGVKALGYTRQDGLGARILRLRRQLCGRAREGLPRSQDRRLVHRGLPRPRNHQARAADARDPQRHGCGGHPGAGEQGRVGSGPGGAQPGLCRGAGDGRPARDLQERRQGDRLAAGQGGELHGQVARRSRRQLLPHPRLAVGRRQTGRRSATGTARPSCSASSWPGCSRSAAT